MGWLGGGNNQMTSSNSNQMYYAPSILIGGGVQTPNNTSTLSNPTSMNPYQRDEITATSSISPQLKANLAAEGGMVKDSGEMTQSTALGIGKNSDPISSVIPNTNPFNFSQNPNINSNWLYIGGFILLLFAFKGKK